jgi:hypothetical protein
MRPSRKVPLGIFVAYVAVGALSPFLAHSRSDVRDLEFGLGFCAAIGLFAWCKLDSQERGVTCPMGALLVGTIAVIGVPYYFLRTMPFRSAALGTLKAILYYLSFGVGFGLGSVTTDALFA